MMTIDKTSKSKKSMRLRVNLLALGLIIITQNLQAGGNDDPLISMIKINQLEQRTGNEELVVLEAQAWLGYDLNKALLKVDIERVKGENENVELQLLYTKAVSPFWNMQLGVRRDIEPESSRNWAVVGFEGLAPYNVEIDSSLYLAKSGRISLRLAAEYELMLTQKLLLIPEVKVNFFNTDDPDTNIGSGLANSEIGLRLAYEIRREIAPYVGVNWEKSYGKTAKFITSEGGSSTDRQIVLGVSTWF